MKLLWLFVLVVCLQCNTTNESVTTPLSYNEWLKVSEIPSAFIDSGGVVRILDTIIDTTRLQFINNQVLIYRSLTYKSQTNLNTDTSFVADYEINNDTLTINYTNHIITALYEIDSENVTLEVQELSVEPEPFDLNLIEWNFTGVYDALIEN